MPPRVRVIQPSPAEATSSAELSYLDRFRRLQVARALGEATFGNPEDGRESLAGEEWVLVVGSERVLFTAATLQALREAAIAGGGCAAAVSLASSGLAEENPVYTLAGYEALEQRFLTTARRTTMPPDPTRLSLWRRETLDRLLATISLAELTSGGTWPPDCARPVAAGMFHEFIDYYGEVRDDVLPYIQPSARDVLEVGCARGLTGRLIQDRLGCRVTGVELNPVIAEEASAVLHHVICGDIEEVEVEQVFDTVIALELFEHLVEPARFLRRMLALLTPGGRVVLSTPNVGHYSVVQDLIRGRWDYLPIGLLCSTHVRFFTRATVEDWVAMAGASRCRIEPQYSEEPPRELARRLKKLGADEESLRTKGFWVIAEP